MEAGLVARAGVAASSLARDLDLPVEDVVVVQNSNTLALRLLPVTCSRELPLSGRRPRRSRSWSRKTWAQSRPLSRRFTHGWNRGCTRVMALLSPSGPTTTP
jgi:hypothetical protein